MIHTQSGFVCKDCKPHFNNILVAPKSKICPQCEERKPIEEFGFRKNCNSRWAHSRCKSCKSKLNREYYAAHKEERAAYMRQYRKKN